MGEIIEPHGTVKTTVGFFIGCMYNFRQQQSALDAMEVLRRNGIRIIIPKEQVCCGSPLIRTGQLAIIETLKRRNIDAFRFRGIDTVMTMCAGCGSTLKHDYVTPFTVMDINEVLTRFGIEPPARLPVKATYHDPCHLMRGQEIKEEPRQLIRQVVELVEMPAICCGSGGGVKSGMPDEAAALGQRRGDEIRKTGVDIVITSCPFCEYHIASHTIKPVKNVMTVLLEGYREKDRQERKLNLHNLSPLWGCLVPEKRLVVFQQVLVCFESCFCPFTGGNNNLLAFNRCDIPSSKNPGEACTAVYIHDNLLIVIEIYQSLRYICIW